MKQLAQGPFNLLTDISHRYRKESVHIDRYIAGRNRTYLDGKTLETIKPVVYHLEFFVLG